MNNALLANGLLTLVLAAATMRGAAALGFSGATLVMDQDVPTRSHCKYSRPFSMIQVRCSNQGLSEIPSTLKTEIQVSRVVFSHFRSWPIHAFFPSSTLRSWTRR